MSRFFPAPPPFGFITLADAVALVASNVPKADRDRVTTIIAEGCEAGRILATYKTITGVADLDRSVWYGHWPSYFDSGTIDLDLPVLANGRPVADGRTVRCTREIYIRRSSLESFIAERELVAPVATEQPAKRGSPEKYDWDDIEQFVRQEFIKRGDFQKPENKVKGWRSQNDLIELIEEYLQVRNEEIPGLTQMKKRVGKILAKIRSAKAELPTDH